MAGPYHHTPLPNLHCSGLGVVLKKDGGWRVIHHLSAPPGTSINDITDPSCFSLHYCSIDTAIKIVNTLGQNALMGKIDLKNAFRQISCSHITHTRYLQRYSRPPFSILYAGISVDGPSSIASYSDTLHLYDQDRPLNTLMQFCTMFNPPPPGPPPFQFPPSHYATFVRTSPRQSTTPQ